MAHRPGSVEGYMNSPRTWDNSCSFEKLSTLHSLICLYLSSVVPDTEKEQEWTPPTGLLLALKEEDQLLVRRLSRHVLSGEGNADLHLWSVT